MMRDLDYYIGWYNEKVIYYNRKYSCQNTAHQKAKEYIRNHIHDDVILKEFDNLFTDDLSILSYCTCCFYRQ